MRISEIMTERAVSIRPDETADVAARLLARGNIGAVPVVDGTGRVVGMLTDRDLVVRCMAAGLSPSEVPVSRIMSAGPLTAAPSEEASSVAARMGRAQVRRMPVVENGRLLGVVSLADLARRTPAGAADALGRVSENISRR